MSKTAHTPALLREVYRDEDGNVDVGFGDEAIATVWSGHARYAPIVVRAVNSHDYLVEALRALRLQALQSSVNDPANEWGQEALEMADAAIRLAAASENTEVAA